MKGQTAHNKSVEESANLHEERVRVWAQDDRSWLAQLSKLSVVGRVTDWLASVPLARAILEGAPGPMAVLDPDRRVAACNQLMAAEVGLTEPQAIGRAMGDLFGCLHAQGPSDGCGTSVLCAHCGLKQGMDSSQSGVSAAKPWSVLSGEGAALKAKEYAASVRPLPEAGAGWSVCSLEDSSHRRRRRMLERIFFHDLMNRAAAMESVTLSAAEDETSLEDRRESLDMALVLSRSIKEEIHSQQILMMAEDGSLVPRLTAVDTAQILRQEAEIVQRLDCAWGKRVHISRLDQMSVRTDPILLGRVLLNLFKNALEASRQDADVHCAVICCGDRAVFSVENEGQIPAEVMRHLFHRSYSTKGADRGLGLYSVKLLTEKYLEGRVGLFATGTTVRFEISLPAFRPHSD